MGQQLYADQVFTRLKRNDVGTDRTEPQRHPLKTITGATTATPIVVTSTAHGFTNGQYVEIEGVLGNTAANGVWVVANAAANTFELTGSVGAGSYTSGGTARISSRRRITTATNATPIVVTAAGHGYANGAKIRVESVGGNTNANGDWVVANVTTNTFELQGSAGNGAYTSGGIATQRREVWVPAFLDGFALGENYSVETLQTEHRAPGAKYSTLSGRNAEAGSIGVPLFPSLARTILDMALDLASGTSLPSFHTINQYWDAALDASTAGLGGAASETDTGRALYGIAANGLRISLDRSGQGTALRVDMPAFANRQTSLTDTPPTPTFPTEDPYSSADAYLAIVFADDDAAPRPFDGDTEELRALSFEFSPALAVEGFRPSSDATKHLAWSNLIRGTPTLTVSATLRASKSDFLRLTRHRAPRRAAVRAILVGSNPSLDTTCVANVAANATSLTVGSTVGGKVGDVLVLAQDTANKQCTVTVTGVTSGTVFATTAVPLAMNGTTETITVRNTATLLEVPLLDVISAPPPTGDGPKTMAVSLNARLAAGASRLYTYTAYDDDGA